MRSMLRLQDISDSIQQIYVEYPLLNIKLTLNIQVFPSFLLYLPFGSSFGVKVPAHSAQAGPAAGEAQIRPWWGEFHHPQKAGSCMERWWQTVNLPWKMGIYEHYLPLYNRLYVIYIRWFKEYYDLMHLTSFLYRTYPANWYVDVIDDPPVRDLAGTPWIICISYRWPAKKWEN